MEADAVWLLKQLRSELFDCAVWEGSDRHVLRFSDLMKSSEQVHPADVPQLVCRGTLPSHIDDQKRRLVRPKIECFPDCLAHDLSTFLLLSPKAVRCLKSAFDSDIRLIPVSADFGEYFAMQIPTRVPIVHRASFVGKWTDDGKRVLWADSYEVCLEPFANRNFVHAEEFPGSVFCSSKVLALIEKHALTGFEFIPEQTIASRRE